MHDLLPPTTIPNQLRLDGAVDLGLDVDDRHLQRPLMETLVLSSKD